ncbi:GABBR2 [Symbiodinium sp. CCMP2592]|nr:GABBR2 [Symbiodinium sp. CCMP2592]
MATPIGSPRVPSTVGSSLVTPVARDVVEPDDSAHASRCTAPASHASLARSASLLASLPAEDDQRAQHHAPPLPCSAAAAFATPGTMHAGMLPASATARALPLLPAFSASAAPAASAPTLLPTDLSSCPLSLRGDPEGARALFGSGPDDRGPPISDPASFRPPRPDSYGPVAGRGGASLPDEPMSEHPGAPHASVATITAADHGGAAPADDNGGRLTGPRAVGALVDEAIGSEASARIAADILAIAQGVTNTQADLDILRNGVSDITEALENKIRDMWELLQNALSDEQQRLTHVQDLIRERQISDLESLDVRFERLSSMISDRFIEFDERIHQFNERRARIATVEQNATHRIEVIRSEMSRALYDHKESNRVLIDQLTARIQHLESAHVRRGGSDMSTPSRPERTQFFDISDHDGDLPRPADLPPVPGERSNESLTNILPKVVGKIILLSPSDRIMAKRQPHFRGDRRIRPFLPQMPMERLPVMFRVSGRIQSMKLLELFLKLEASLLSPDQALPSRVKSPMTLDPSRPGRGLQDGMMRCLADRISLAVVPAHRFSIVRLVLSHLRRTQVSRQHFDLLRQPMLCPRCPPSMPERGFLHPVPRHPELADPRPLMVPTITGVHMAVVSEDMDIMGLAMSLVAVVARPVAHLVVRLVVVALLAGVVRPMAALIRQAFGLPVDRAGPGGPKGDGSLSDAKKAKCKSFRLDPEPEPAQLRRWIVDMKERVANAFAYDPGYVLSWVEIPDGTRYEDLLDECKYGMLENECNSAFRDCVKSIALKNKIQTETERMHTINRRPGSRQILWLLYDFLRPHVTGDSTFKLVDLMKITIDRFTHGSEQERLEAFSNRWDHVLAGISVDRPEDPVLCALFYEQVREFRCLELDMQLWDRDVSVRNYAYLRTVCVNAITTWRRRRNQEKMYTATRSSSAQRRYAERESVPKELAETLVAQTILPEARFANAIFP